MWHVWKTQKPWNQRPRHLLWHWDPEEREGVISVFQSFFHHMVLRNTPDDDPQTRTFAVESRTKGVKKKSITKQWLDWNSLEFFFSSITCYFLLVFFFFTATKTNNQKTQTSGTRAEPVTVCISPFIYGTETEPHKWAGGSCPIAYAPHRRRGKINARQTLKT